MEALGLDIVDIERISKLHSRFGDKLSARILGPEELTIYSGRVDKPQFLAGRFAAKEAIIKALGRFLKDRPPLKSLQIVSDDSGQPEVKFPPEVQTALAGHKCLISITHEKKMAAAVALIMEKK